MYYRVAIQLDSTPLWWWKSTALRSLDALFQWFRLYRGLPHNSLRVFSSPSRERMDEQLTLENLGYGSTSVTATQFLQARMITSLEMKQEALTGDIQENKQTTPTTTIIKTLSDKSSKIAQTLDERGISASDKRRGELEHGNGGDHDIPYQFTLPAAMPQTLAWVKLLTRVQNGTVQL
jgi:hypothetical protein